MTTPNPQLANEMANAIRILAIDAVEKAKSGHPGAPMGMAEIAEVLWNRHLKHSVAALLWVIGSNRDYRLSPLKKLVHCTNFEQTKL